MSEDSTNSQSLESTKKFIRSILNSNPCNMNTRTLMKDYYEFMGKPLPYKNLGFQCIDDFLHAIPDVVRVQGSGPYAILNVVINEKVEHISAMVTKQKLPSKKKITGQRRPTTPSFKRQLPPRMQYPRRVQPQFIEQKSTAAPEPQSRAVSAKSCSGSSENSYENNANKENNSRSLFPDGPIKFKCSQRQLSLPAPAFCLSIEPNDNLTNFETNNEENKSILRFENAQNPNQNEYFNNQYLQNQTSSENRENSNILPESGTCQYYNDPINATETENVDFSNQGASYCPSSQKTRQPSQQPHFLSTDKHSKLYTLKKEPAKPLLSQQSLNQFTIATTSKNDGSVIEKPPILYKFFESLDQCKAVIEQSPLIEEKPARKEPRVPDAVRNNLRKLIKNHPEGIWCRNLPTSYRKMFRRPLLYLEYGYHNLIDMVADLNSIFHWVQPESDDCILFDCNQPIPEKYAKAEQKKVTENVQQPISVILSKSNWNEFIWMFPDDILPLGEEIEREFHRDDIKVNSVIEIVVGEVYDPSKFWVYIKEPHLDALMNEMQPFYNENSKKYLIPSHLLRDGLYCAHLIYGEYHRALVVDSSPQVKGEVRLYYIDYGTVVRVPADGICFLSKRFTHLKGQAIRARLADICPREEESYWMKNTTDYFRSLIEGRQLSAKICKINNQELLWEILLADTTDSEAFYINDKLVEDGYAQYFGDALPPRGQCTPNPALVKHLYLFPTPFEIEHGAAPSADELKFAYNLDIPLHLYLPQYYQNYSLDELKNMQNMNKMHIKHKTKSRNEFRHDYRLEDYLHGDRDLEMDFFHDVKSEIKGIVKKNEEEKAAETWRGDEFENDYDDEEEDEKIITEWRRAPNTKSTKTHKKAPSGYYESISSDSEYEKVAEMNNVNQKSQSNVTEILERIERLKNDLLTISIADDIKDADITRPDIQVNDIPQQSSSRKVENYLREQRKFLTNPFLNPNYDEDMKSLKNLPNPFLYEDNELDVTEKSSFNVNATPFEPKMTSSTSKSDAKPKWSDDLFGQEYRGNGSYLEQQEECSEEVYRDICLNDDMSISNGSFAATAIDTGKKEVEIQTEFTVHEEPTELQAHEAKNKDIQLEIAPTSKVATPPVPPGMSYPMVPPYPPPPHPWYNYNYNMTYNYWMQYQAAMQSMMLMPPQPPPPGTMSMYKPPMMPPPMAGTSFTRAPPGFPVKITNLDSPTGSQ